MDMGSRSVCCACFGSLCTQAFEIKFYYQLDENYNLIL